MPRRARFLVFLSLCLLASMATLPAGAATATPRVASMHLCSDQLLLALAEPGQIASLSYLAADPAWSPVAAQAQGFHLNHGQAEELLPLAPELVFTGAFSTTFAARLLEQQGLRVERLDVANSLEQQSAQIRHLGTLLEAAGKAEAIIGDMQRTVESATTELRPRLQGKRAAFYSNNGYSFGQGTLQHDFLLSLGLHNSAGSLQGVAQLPLEQLLRDAPDYLFIDRAPQSEAPLAHALLKHPALRALQGKLKLIVLPDMLFQCASPQYVDAYAVLEAQL